MGFRRLLSSSFIPERIRACGDGCYGDQKRIAGPLSLSGDREAWRDRFLLGAENALRAHPKDEDALKDEQIKKLKQKVGELVLDLDVLKEASKDRPFPAKTSDE